MKAICVQCKIEMKCKKNEVTVARVGSCNFRYGDLWECPKCKKEIVIGFGSPLSLDETDFPATDFVVY